MGKFADFETEFAIKVAKGVEWVPLHSAGIPVYSDEEIIAMKCLTAEQKKDKIHTIYDAINLFYLNGFHEKDDTVKIKLDEDGEWEYHKTGYTALVENCGSCASGASALAYLLRDDYEKTGFLCFLRPDASGHVFNYFEKNNFIYIVDPLTYIKEYATYIVKETGKLSDFIKRKYFTNGLFRVKEIGDYMEYFRRYLRCRNISFFFYYYENRYDRCIPLKCLKRETDIHLTLPMNRGIKLFYKNPSGIRVSYSETAVERK